MTNINQKQLDEYLDIFGKSKMQGLLKDYLAESSKSWAALDKFSDAEKQQVFHCWRSSSLVFGMEDFSKMCTTIEDDFLNNRLGKIANFILDVIRLREEYGFNPYPRKNRKLSYQL